MWGWDATLKRYRDSDTGRFMPRTTVLGFVSESIRTADIASDQIITFMADGLLSPDDFAGAFRQELKEEYIRQYLLGIGGRTQMTPADWGSIGGMLKEQYGHLDGFVDDLRGGELSEEQIRARAEMYVNSAREAYETAHSRNAEKLGLTEESWSLGASEHCDDCLAYAAQGWQPLGTFPTPGSGATQCMTNCACHKTYRNPATGQSL